MSDTESETIPSEPDVDLTVETMSKGESSGNVLSAPDISDRYGESTIDMHVDEESLTRRRERRKVSAGVKATEGKIYQATIKFTKLASAIHRFIKTSKMLYQQIIR